MLSFFKDQVTRILRYQRIRKLVKKMNCLPLTRLPPTAYFWLQRCPHGDVWICASIARDLKHLNSLNILVSIL